MISTAIRYLFVFGGVAFALRCDDCLHDTCNSTEIYPVFCSSNLTVCMTKTDQNSLVVNRRCGFETECDQPNNFLSIILDRISGQIFNTADEVTECCNENMCNRRNTTNSDLNIDTTPFSSITFSEATIEEMNSTEILDGKSGISNVSAFPSTTYENSEFVNMNTTLLPLTTNVTEEMNYTEIIENESGISNFSEFTSTIRNELEFENATLLPLTTFSDVTIEVINSTEKLDGRSDIFEVINSTEKLDGRSDISNISAYPSMQNESKAETVTTALPILSTNGGLWSSTELSNSTMSYDTITFNPAETNQTESSASVNVISLSLILCTLAKIVLNLEFL